MLIRLKARCDNLYCRACCFFELKVGEILSLYANQRSTLCQTDTIWCSLCWILRNIFNTLMAGKTGHED